VNTRKYLVIITSFIWLISANIAHAEPVNPKVIHVLNRLSLGIRPGEIEQVQKIGVERYIQQQLNPDSIQESTTLTERIAKLETINLSPSDRLQYVFKQQVDGQKPTPEVIKNQKLQSRKIINQAVESRLSRAIYSQRQLNEVMVDFWYNHFNVYADKGVERFWIGAYEQQAIRPHVLGKFSDLLAATARHPSMLYYLDNWRNTAPNPNKKGRSQGLNENYARELMELHTLGVDGGYKQGDVIALARIFTGWGFKQPSQKVPDGYNFRFNSNRHDFGDKLFLNQKIVGSGIAEGEQALNLLSRHPSTARHISFKLAQYFVTDNPPKSLTDLLSKRFIATDGDIKLVLNTLFNSPEFWNSKYYGTKFKTPYQYAISSLRSTETDVNNVGILSSLLRQFGMPLYGCQTPNGYKNTQDAWLNPNSLTQRLSYATNLARGRLRFSTSTSTTIPASSLSTMPMVVVDPVKLAATLGNKFSTQTQQAISSSSPEIRAALILGSSEFMQK
jgi:uncharacterized protein (DUF1800 family)